MLKIIKKLPALTIILALCLLSCTHAPGIQTIQIPSPSMGRTYPALIVHPDPQGYFPKSYPVLYLLHGHSGHFTGWLDIADKMQEWANQYQMIIVCPDGDTDSWYIDSPMQKHRKFEQFISKELVEYIDTHYKTKAKATSRGISGVSMGGHGAVYNALKHPDVFGVAAASSGGLDLLPFYNHWNLEHLLGTFSQYHEDWKKYSCYYVLDELFPSNSGIQKLEDDKSIARKKLQLWIDCGTQDFFLDVNRAFHKKLLEKNITHQYLEKPGGHTLEYWQDSYKKQILFFAEKFGNSDVSGN